MCQKKNARPVVCHVVVSPEDFVTSYRLVARNCGTTSDLADLLGMNYGTVVARIRYYREIGVKLPPLQVASRGRAIDVAKLNRVR